ncbi:MAG: hypothetical protein ACREN4_04270 [Candidatus Dormibacteria bacterium]
MGLIAALSACSSTPAPQREPTPRATPTPALGLLGLGGEVGQAFSLGPPYVAGKRLELGVRQVYAVKVPATAAAAVTALAAALEVPGPPLETGAGWAYNLSSTTGYQLTTDAGLDSFNFHPNHPVDETGATPTVGAAEQFASHFLSADRLPAGGGLEALPDQSTYHAADRTVFFQWTLHGAPVVNVEGSPEEISADVAAGGSGALSLVGISGAVPYPALGNFAPYAAMPLRQVVASLKSGAIDPGSYLLDAQGQPFPSPSLSASPTQLERVYLAYVDSFGFAVPVYVFTASGAGGPGQFVTCAPVRSECVPLRLAASPSPTASG